VTKIDAREVCKSFATSRGTVHALVDFSLSVHDGEFLSLVGPSGCGKSTFLRIVAGLVPATSGEVSIERDRIAPGAETGAGRRGHRPRPSNAMVFQEYAVFPWKTVVDNVAFGLQMRGYAAAARRGIAMDWIERVGLRRFAHHYPHQLSGGMRQRVGIARALANDPEILLMDEPLGALDAQTRTVLQEQLLRLWEQQRKTVVYVTHSIEEAVLLGDRVVIMTAHPGTHKAQFDVPFSRPRSLATTADPEFGRLSYAIWEALRDEVQRSMEEQG
jgi:NitT/TauT family transport system ATP-binding protein